MTLSTRFPLVVAMGAKRPTMHHDSKEKEARQI